MNKKEIVVTCVRPTVLRWLLKRPTETQEVAGVEPGIQREIQKNSTGISNSFPMEKSRLKQIQHQDSSPKPDQKIEL